MGILDVFIDEVYVNCVFMLKSREGDEHKERKGALSLFLPIYVVERVDK